MMFFAALELFFAALDYFAGIARKIGGKIGFAGARLVLASWIQNPDKDFRRPWRSPCFELLR